jgi:hypothetical protein
VALAAIVCAFLAVVVDYVAGPRMSVFDILVDDFSVLDLTSILMVLWALTLLAACVLTMALRSHGMSGYLFIAATLCGLGATANEAFGMFESARMIGENAGSVHFLLYELRLVSALALLALTLIGSAVQLAITDHRDLGAAS